MPSTAKQFRKSMSSTRDLNISTSELNTQNCLMIYVVHSPPSPYIWSSAAACLVNIVFAIAGTILNSLVLFAYWKSSKLRSKLQYFEIMILSSIDVLVTTFVHLLFLVKWINEVLGRVECWHAVSYYFALSFLSGASFWTLFTISVERYLSIVHPIFHRSAVNKRRFIVACICFCSFHYIGCFSMPFYALHLSKISSVAIVLMCSTYTFTFLSIFRVARRKLRKANHGDDTDAGQEKSERSFLQELKMAKTLLAIVAIYLACLLPVGVVGELQSPWDRHKEPSRGIAYALPWATTLASMSSTLNCLAFFWANKALRKGGIKIVKNCFGC